MNTIARIKKLIKNPLIIFPHLGFNQKLNFLSDKTYLKLLFRSRMKKRLNLEEPETFSEKLQYLKLYDRNPLYTKLVDKYEVREYISNTIGEEYLVPLYGVWEEFEDIDFAKLPNQFVLKTTHDSGGVVICQNKQKLDLEKAKKIINKSLHKNYYYEGREWPYKNVQARIICEKYLKDYSATGIKDYKFLCFHGEPAIMIVATGPQDNRTKDFYDLNFNPINVKQMYPNNPFEIKKPEHFDRMISLSRTLSANIPHVRVDFYEIDGKIFFGELTFYHFSGMVDFQPKNYDYELGELLDLSEIRKT
ncbi:ATP-grasp fold amidoligase family protein [Sporosarcina ureae]|uniref:ATP-grasp fold amidoligase family protein n=1 Tax=Sporosarcina ureae TaxID=1571 RepID=UPI0026F1678C|nr:ATP-grasp fold amidoligase family protein [Sporosarcina ureae]